MYEINLGIKYFCGDKTYLIWEYILKFKMLSPSSKDLLFFPFFFGAVLSVIYEPDI